MGFDASRITPLVLLSLALYFSYMYKDKIMVYYKGFINTLNRIIGNKNVKLEEKEINNNIPDNKFPCFRCNNIYQTKNLLYTHNCIYVHNLNKQEDKKR